MGIYKQPIKVSADFEKDKQPCTSLEAISKAGETEEINHLMTVREAGTRGGRATLEKYGKDYYSRIGRKGGERTAQLYREFLSEFGKKGGRPRRPNLSEYREEEDR
jgi:general stress protein YciG